MNQIALIFSDNNFYTVADDRELLPNRCHSANLYHEKYGITPFQETFALFPLHRSRRLGGYIVHNAVNVLDLVAEAV